MPCRRQDTAVENAHPSPPPAPIPGTCTAFPTKTRSRCPRQGQPPAGEGSAWTNFLPSSHLELKVAAL